MKLRRGIRVHMKPVYMGEYGFIGYDVYQNDKLFLTFEDDYFIYMKNVNLQKDGVIVGRYLGEATETLIDGYCRNLYYDDKEGYTVEGERARIAKMLAVRNGNTKEVIKIL